MSYEDLKLIEAYEFAKSVIAGEQMEPGFREALAVAEVQEGMVRSLESGSWEDVGAISLDG